MASDSSDSTKRRKRSSSADVNDSQEAPKRRKHHYHRKHRHHRSKKHDVIEDATQQEERNQDDCSRIDAVVSAGEEMSTAGVNGKSLGIDYDMEEGEIIEEDEGDVVGNGGVSFDNSSMGVDVSHKGENNKFSLPLEEKLDQERRNSGPLIVDMDYRKDSKGFERKENNRIEHFSRNVEKSPQHSRGRRSRSRSVHQDVSQSDTSKELDYAYHSKRKYGIDSDDERVTDHQSDSRHRSRDLEDRSPSYVRRMSRLDMNYRAGSGDMHRDRSPEREREREKGRERERETDRDRNKGQDRERRRDRERERHRDREREDRVRREREKESSRYRDRDRNYDVPVVGYGDRDRYDDSRNKRHEEPYGRQRGRQSDPKKANISTEMSFEKTKSDEDEQEEYEDRIALQLANQEEDDLEKIKEESRRRREAILVKYSGKNLQQESENKIDYSEKDSSGVPEISDSQVEGSDDCDADLLVSFGKSPQPNGPAVQEPSDTAGLGAGTPKSERSNDMFCDDIFGESPAGGRKIGKADGVTIERTSLHDNWDDAEGYYSYRFGEILDSRYEIIAAHGKGVFSTVIRAKDLKVKPGDPDEVAIKMIRSNDTMYKAGMDEMVILKKLVGADPENRRHCVRFLSNFKYRNHLCLVFESLHMNLREILKKFGRNIGLKLTAVRAYAKQLFIALKHLKNCGVLHCDIKPDNMLVNETKNILKLCDFGSAMFAGKNEVTPYLVSRFYRAPEIILGLTYDHPVDMWSVGCCLYELFTGKVLFPGPSNNDMLRLHMELKGPFPKKMLRKGSFTMHHFDQDLNFLATEEDPVTKKAIKRLMLNVKPKDMGTLISSSGEDPKMLANFKDLLEKMFMLDPEKRIAVSQALSHPFITGK